MHPSVKDKLLQVKESTFKNDKMILNLALSYGGKDEIISLCKKDN
jgi:undecaprenyl diphosphate synthase